MRMKIVNTAHLVAGQTGHCRLVHRGHVIARCLRHRPEAEDLSDKYREGNERGRENGRMFYLGIPRKGSGVTDEFLTTPELLTGAGETILLGWPWWYALPAGLCLFAASTERLMFHDLLLCADRWTADGYVT